MTDVFFYHLQGQPLDAVLPRLLERTLGRGWRALVKASTPERLGALDDRLWTYTDESFLPHARDEGAGSDDQPILLTLGDRNGNGADALFLVDGAAVPVDLSGYARVLYLLDGLDEAAVADARTAYRALRAAGHDLSYWQQDEAGAWQKRGT